MMLDHCRCLATELKNGTYNFASSSAPYGEVAEMIVAIRWHDHVQLILQRNSMLRLFFWFF